MELARMFLGTIAGAALLITAVYGYSELGLHAGGAIGVGFVGFVFGFIGLTSGKVVIREKNGEESE
jgi:hypothetical protein